MNLYGVLGLYIPAFGRIVGRMQYDLFHAYTVDDVDRTCRELAEKGMSLETEPRDYYWGRSAYLRDPDGNKICTYCFAPE